MPKPIPCPSEQDLQRLLLGQIPEPEAERLEEHLEKCDPCVRTASTLKAEDTLAEVVRTQGALPRVPPGEVVEELMQRLEQLRPAPPAANPQAPAGSIPLGDKPPEGIALTAALSKGAPLSENPTVAAPTLPTAVPSAEAVEVIYDFLAPAQGPQELGRLGSYRVLKVLGAGGMGVVFQAEDPHLDRLVALKAMLPALASNPSARQRFLREAKAAAAIEHDHIVHINQVGEERGVPFLAMPLLKGEPLNERLKREKKLPVNEILRIGREIAEGLAAAHEHGLVHRDIKPGNIWLEDSRARVKILDFGLARAAADTAHLTQSGAIVGTPAYMAPEQTRGGPIDYRADLFSLGCVLYRMTTGEAPFKGTDTMSILAALALDHPTPPRERDPNIPPAVSDLVMQLLAKKPEDRPPSAQAVVERIQAIEPGRPRPGAVQARSSGRRLIRVAMVVALGMLAWGGYLLAPVIYRITTEKGEVVIETNDPNIEVVIKGGGKEVIIVDPQSKQRWQLDTAKYQLSLADQPAGLTIDLPGQQPFILRRQGDKVATVTRLAVQEAEGNPHSADRKVGEKRMLEGFTDVVWDVAFSPDGRSYLATGGLNQLYDRTNGQELRQFPGSGWFATFSADGRRVLTADLPAQNLLVWDAATGKRLQTIVANVGRTRNGDFSPDGKMVIANHGNTVRVWDLQTGNQVAVFDGDPDSQHSFQMVSGSRQLLVANPDHSIRVVDMTTWQEVGRWKPHPDPISDVAISPDGRRLLVCTRGDQEGAFVWDVASGQEVGRLGGLGKSLPRVAVFAPDGRRAISIDQERTIILWDVAGGKELQRWQKQGDIVSVAIAPDGRDALFGLFSHKAFLMRLPDPPPPAKPEVLYRIPWQVEHMGVGAHIFHTGFSSDGRLFFGAGGAGPKGVIRVWEVATGKQVKEFVAGGEAWYSFAQFLPGGQYLVASYHKENDLYLWEIATGKVVRKFVGHTEPDPGFAVSPDGKRLLSWGDDRTVRLWDVDTGKELRKLEGHTDKAAGVFSPDGKQVLTFSPDKTLRLWDRETGKELQRLEGHTDSCTGCFSPDGKQVLSYSADHTIRLWDAGTGKEVRRFEGPTDKVSFAGFVAGGRLVVGKSDEKKFWVWEMADGKRVSEIDYTPFGREGRSLTATPDGRLGLVSDVNDASVRVLDLATGEEIHRYDNILNARAFSFSPDGTLAVAGSFRVGMFVFRLPPPVPAAGPETPTQDRTAPAAPRGTSSGEKGGR